MAWDEWKKNSFARHAEAYPDIWYGIWNLTDFFFYNSVKHKQAGETVNNRYFHGTDFPVENPQWLTVRAVFGDKTFRP